MNNLNIDKFFYRDEIQQSIFEAMDSNNTDSISFDEYIKALSIISRGTVDERADRNLIILF